MRYSVLHVSSDEKSGRFPSFSNRCFGEVHSMNKPISSFISKWECMNAAYRSSMEDVCVVYPFLPNNRSTFFAALMDGHGGCATASFVASRIGENVDHALQDKDFKTYEDALRYAFLLTDVDCRMNSLMASGCTCASVMITRDEQSGSCTLYSANVGDSRVVLFANGKAHRISHVVVVGCFQNRIIRRRIGMRWRASMRQEEW